MRTGLRHGPAGGAAPAAPPISLTERLAALAVPCPVHPSVHRIEAAAIAWSRRHGLRADPGGGAHLLAGRAFARYGTDAATMFARWLIWMSAAREDPAALDGVPRVARGDEPGPAAVERAFADLWRVCAPRMSDGWREGFLAGLAAQRAALLRTAAPAAGDYPPFGRDRFGRYLFDLVEPCAGVEAPAAVRRSPHWAAVVEASCDVVTWCTDLVAGGGYLTAAAGLTGSTAGLPASRGGRNGAGGGDPVAWVTDRLVERMDDLWTAARAIPQVVERRGLDTAAAREVIQVTCAFLTIPRAYLEWLLESPRYRHLA
ncbi:terpene synthase family protein [Streptosporangium sandarakinum]|uniref:terpene synthase family protein n=1 Tax=Streptosporangium sandarakinum TaxID=1260955 RepID=UPI0034351BAF